MEGSGIREWQNQGTHFILQQSVNLLTVQPNDLKSRVIK
jgi:hypothetical protein